MGSRTGDHSEGSLPPDRTGQAEAFDAIGDRYDEAFPHKEGQLEDDYFQSWAKRMLQIAQEESFRRMIENPAMKIMHDDFDAYLRTLLRTSGAMTTGLNREGVGSRE